MSKTAKISVGKEYVEPTQTSGGADRLPPSMANGAWNYVHYPGGWEWVEKVGAFLPTLCTISRAPGSNGVTKDGDMTFAKANISTKDGRIIAPHDPRLGEHAGYLIAFPCAGGGSYHAHRGSTFTVLPNGRVLAEPVPTFDAFRAALAKSGIVHPLEEWVYNLIREREHKALERLENDYASKGGEFRKEKVLARRARVATMEAAWAELQGDAKPKRKVTVQHGAEADL